jgi:hypothetical protein
VTLRSTDRPAELIGVVASSAAPLMVEKPRGSMTESSSSSKAIRMPPTPRHRR